MSSELTMVLMLAITAGAAAFVAWPLLMGRTRAEEFFGAEPGESVVLQLTFQRDTVYAAMKELEFDAAMGNLSQPDFQELQERYKRKAVAILKRIDDANAGRSSAAEVLREADMEMPVRRARAANGAAEPRVDLDVEQEIEAFRRQSRDRATVKPPSPAGAQQPARPGAALTCPACGSAVKDPEAVFCSKCGAPVRSTGRPAGPRPSAEQRRRRSGAVKGDRNA